MKTRVLAAAVLALALTAGPASAAPQITEYSSGSTHLTAIAGDRAGRAWFAYSNMDGATSHEGVRALNPDGSLFWQREEPNGVRAITTAPNGDVWWALEASAHLVQWRAATQSIMHWQLPLSTGSVAVTADGAVWFSLNTSVGRIAPGAGMTVFPVPASIGNASRLTAGPDGRVWFVASVAKVAAVTTDGAFSGYGAGISGTPSDLTAGGDGNVWASEANDMVARITPSGQVQEHSAPGSVNGVGLGGDGNVWAARGGELLRVSPAGTMSPFSLPASPLAGAPFDVAGAGAGALWYGRTALNEPQSVLGRVVLEAPSAVTGTAGALTPDGATVTASVDPNGAATGVVFEYGTSTAYGSSTAIVNAGAGDVAETVEARLSGLAPGTTYHYRVVATSAVGKRIGEDMTLRTPDAPAAQATGTGTGAGTSAPAGNPTPGAVPPGAAGSAAALPAQTARPYPTFQRYRHRYQRFVDLYVDGLEGGETVSVACRARGCRTRRWRARVTRPGRLGLLKVARDARLRFGGTVAITIARPGFRTETWSVRIVDKTLSRLKRTCADPTTNRSIPC